MKTLNKVLLTLGALTGVGTLAGLGVHSVVANSENAVVATTSDHVRVYVYLDNGWTDWSGLSFYIHYWGGTTGSTWATCPVMTKVVSDYYQGLWYYDLPADTTTVLFKTAAGDVDNWRKTENLSLTTYSPSQYVFYVKEAVSSNNIRWWDKVSTAGMNSGQLAAVLATIHVCDADSGYGYNAWPQLNSLFVTPSTGRDNSTSLTNWNSQTTTIGDTINIIQHRYGEAHPSGSAIAAQKTQDSTETLVLGGLAVLSAAAAGGYFFTRKRKHI